MDRVIDAGVEATVLDDSVGVDAEAAVPGGAVAVAEGVDAGLAGVVVWRGTALDEVTGLVATEEGVDGCDVFLATVLVEVPGVVPVWGVVVPEGLAAVGATADTLAVALAEPPSEVVTSTFALCVPGVAAIPANNADRVWLGSNGPSDCVCELFPSMNSCACAGAWGAAEELTS